jgi:hypothetical protein
MPRLTMMRFSIAAIVGAAVLAGSGLVHAQVPVHHGSLTIRSARGRIDKNTGIGSLRVKNWDLLVAFDSDGIAPDREPILIAIGETERLVIPSGQVRASRNGRVFTFRNPKVRRGVRFFQMRKLKNSGGAKERYRVRFSLTGIDLSGLLLEYPLCKSLAVIVGDDDGFEGVDLTRPGPKQFCCTKVSVLGACEPDNWPWL